jgi:uncharacterized Zn finger protein
MDALTDSWTRRMKTLLEHATGRPIPADPRGGLQVANSSRVFQPAGYWSLFRGVMQRSSGGNVRVAPGVVSVQGKGNTVEIHVPLLGSAEKDAIVDLLASKVGYFLLMAIWAEKITINQMKLAKLVPADQNSIKIALETTMIERAIHLVPESPETIQISCTCSKSSIPDETPSTEQPRYCEHVFHLLPEIIGYLDTKPGLFFHMRGFPVDDLLVLMGERVARLHPSGEIPGATSGPKAGLGPVATRDACKENIIGTFWDYPGTDDDGLNEESQSIDVSNTESLPFEVHAPAQLDQGSIDTPPAGFESILTSIYALVKSHEKDFNQILASIDDRER